MKVFKSKIGPVREQPFFRQQEIEDICLSELKKLNFLPEKPEPIRIDRFIEKKFNVTPRYEDLDDGILGFTKFGSNGVEEIYIAKSLEMEGTEVSDRRVRTTLAHEAGHGLLHSYIFALGKGASSLFYNEQPDEPKILCREVAGTLSTSRQYDGRWWEYQANKMMASLLLPLPLVHEVVKEFLETKGFFGGGILPEVRRSEVERKLSEIFNVNRIVAELRLKELYPLTDSKQLSL